MITPRVTKIETLFNRGVRSQAVTDTSEEVWAKFTVALIGNGLETAIRLSPSLFLARPETRELTRGLVLEMVAIAKAEGVSLRSGIVDEVVEIGDRVPKDYTRFYAPRPAGRTAA